MRLILATILLLMGFGYAAIAEWYPEAAWLQSSLLRYVFPALVTAIGLLGILLARKLLSRDPVLLSWAIWGLAGSFLLMPLLVAKNEQKQVEARLQEEVEENRKQLTAAMLRRQQEQKAIEADRRERMKTDRFAQYEGRVPDDVLDTLRAIDKEMVAEVQRYADDYVTTLDANPTKGPNSWVVLRTLDDLEAEISAHAELYAETRSFAQFIETFEETYTTRIDALNLEPPADRVAVAELERILQSWERANLYTLRRLDVEMLSEALKALNILKDAWGTWQYNPRDNALLFENPEQEYAFQQAVFRMQEISKELKDTE